MMSHVASDRKETKSVDIFKLFDVGAISPGSKLLVNLSISIVSLLRQEYEGISVIGQRVLTESEMRVLLPLLGSPFCCPQEVLQASYYCTYDVLLQSVCSTDAHALISWNNLVYEYSHRLRDASQRRTRRAEMKGIYNALSSLRQKLEQFGLTIRARRDGYYLAPFAIE